MGRTLVVQFAQRSTSPCHSEARFIGEESAVASEKQQIPQANVALRLTILRRSSQTAHYEHSGMREQTLHLANVCEIVDCPDRLPAGVIEVTSCPIKPVDED
jgi:hypothetical protein